MHINADVWIKKPFENVFDFNYYQVIYNDIL